MPAQASAQSQKVHEWDARENWSYCGKKWLTNLIMILLGMSLCSSGGRYTACSLKIGSLSKSCKLQSSKIACKLITSIHNKNSKSSGIINALNKTWVPFRERNSQQPSECLMLDVRGRWQSVCTQTDELWLIAGALQTPFWMRISPAVFYLHRVIILTEVSGDDLAPGTALTRVIKLWWASILIDLSKSKSWILSKATAVNARTCCTAWRRLGSPRKMS